MRAPRSLTSVTPSASPYEDHRNSVVIAYDVMIRLSSRGNNRPSVRCCTICAREAQSSSTGDVMGSLRSAAFAAVGAEAAVEGDSGAGAEDCEPISDLRTHSQRSE